VLEILAQRPQPGKWQVIEDRTEFCGACKEDAFCWIAAGNPKHVKFYCGACFLKLDANKLQDEKPQAVFRRAMARRSIEKVDELIAEFDTVVQVPNEHLENAEQVEPTEEEQNNQALTSQPSAELAAAAWQDKTIPIPAQLTPDKLSDLPLLEQSLVSGALAVTESRTESETETRSGSDVLSESTASKAAEEHQQETLLVPSGPAHSEPATNLTAEGRGPAAPLTDISGRSDATVGHGLSSTPSGPAAAGSGFADAGSAAATSLSGSASSLSGSASSLSGSASSLSEPASSLSGSASSHSGSASSLSGSASSLSGSVSTLSGSASTSSGPASSLSGSASTLSGSASTLSASASTVCGSTITQSGAAVLTSEPAVPASETTNVQDGPALTPGEFADMQDELTDTQGDFSSLSSVVKHLRNSQQRKNNQ